MKFNMLKGKPIGSIATCEESYFHYKKLYIEQGTNSGIAKE